MPNYLVGVKDSVLRGSSGCVQSDAVNCTNQNLLDVSSAQICVSCASGNQVQGVGSFTTFSALQQGITAMDGWVIQLAPNTGSTTLGAERSLVNPTLIGGAVFFPTFTPNNDICVLDRKQHPLFDVLPDRNGVHRPHHGSGCQRIFEAECQPW